MHALNIFPGYPSAYPWSHSSTALLNYFSYSIKPHTFPHRIGGGIMLLFLWKIYMKNKFIYHIAAPIYILFAEKNKEFILEIIASTIPLLWYTTEIITGNIQKNFIYAFISNIIMFIFYVKSVFFNSEIKIIQIKKITKIYAV